MMKNKIILLCILATLTTLTLTACTGKVPPSPNDDNVSRQESDSTGQTSSQESDSKGQTSSQEIDPTGQTSSQKIDPTGQTSNVENNSEPATGEKKGYEEMPQNVIDYLEANAKELQYELIDTPEHSLEYTNEQLYYVYDSYFDGVNDGMVSIGSVLNINDESNPEILYLQKPNLNGSRTFNAETGERSPFTRGFSCAGTVVGVKLDDEDNVIEFYTMGDRYELFDYMLKRAYIDYGLEPEQDFNTVPELYSKGYKIEK